MNTTSLLLLAAVILIFVAWRSEPYLKIDYDQRGLHIEKGATRVNYSWSQLKHMREEVGAPDVWR